MLKKKTGQIFIVGYHGETPSDEFLKFAEEWQIGGVIVFARNIKDPAALPENLKKISQAAGHEIFTAIDQEGGLVMRILSQGSVFPSAMALAQIDEPERTRSIYKAIGDEMASLGLNFNLAPVLDINHPDNPGIGARAFSEDVEVVCKHGIEAINGLADSPVLSCAKHFPGKGSARIDSHLSLPVINKTEEQMIKQDIQPFVCAIKNKVDAIMTSHVFFPALESQKALPATLSKNVMTNFLRNKLGFEGLLITDDLEMGAITESFGVAEASSLAFYAGSDLLLICHNLENQKLAAEKILCQLKASPEAGRRIVESIARIQKARKKLSDNKIELSLNVLAKKHEMLVKDTYEKSILIKNNKNLFLPLKRKANEKILFCCPKISSLVQVEEHHHDNGISDELKQHFSGCSVVVYEPTDSCSKLFDLVYTSYLNYRPEKIVFFSYNAHLLDGQKNAALKIAELKSKFGIVALRNPYDIYLFENADFSACTFGFRSLAISSLIQKITA